MVNLVIRVRIAVLTRILVNRDFTIRGPRFLPGTYRLEFEFIANFQLRLL
jgi:hypothetical protein